MPLLSRCFLVHQGNLHHILEAGDTVMSDKGFLVGQDLGKKKVKLVMPPFKGSDRSQFTNTEKTYRQTYRHTDRQTDRQTNMYHRVCVTLYWLF